MRPARDFLFIQLLNTRADILFLIRAEDRKQKLRLPELPSVFLEEKRLRQSLFYCPERILEEIFM